MKPQTAGDRTRAWNHSCMQMIRAKFYISRDGRLCRRVRQARAEWSGAPQGPGRPLQLQVGKCLQAPSP